LEKERELPPSAGRGAFAMAGDAVVRTPYVELTFPGGSVGGVALNWMGGDMAIGVGRRFLPVSGRRGF
jgi:hypothetical protein